MQLCFNRKLFLLPPDLTGTAFRSTAFQDNRTLLSGIESYGVGGNKTLIGVNFVTLFSGNKAATGAIAVGTIVTSGRI
jgi:hypothetical protein